MRIVRLVVALVLLGSSTTACAVLGIGAPDPTTLAAGQTAGTSATASLTGTETTVRVPSGEIELVLTTPRRRVPPALTTAAGGLTAADGVALVGLAWVLQREVDDRTFASGSLMDLVAVPQAIGLTVVAGGESYPLSHVGTMLYDDHDEGTPRGTVWLGVPEGEPLRLEVTYDGVTQRVDATTGAVARQRAADLYRRPSVIRQEMCRTPDTIRGRWLSASCLIDSVRLPYVVEDGWPRPGKTWLVVAVSTNVPPREVAWVPTLAGQRPRSRSVSWLPSKEDPEGHAEVLVFEVDRSAGRLPFRLKVRFNEDNGPPATFTARADIGAPS